MKELENKTKKSSPPSLLDIIEELDELKNIALNCFDKNGNPNISSAIKAVEAKSKIISNLNNNKSASTVVQMGEVKIDGIQLKLNIGENCKEI